jgi:hypothetical protein
MSLDEGNSRRSYDQEGAGLNITNFPPESANPPYMLPMSLSGAMRLTINRSFARTVSRTDQSTETFFRKFSANSTVIFFNISSPSSRTEASFVSSAS